MEPTPDNLRHVRAMCGLTQKAAAERMMLSGPLRVSHYETGVRTIDPARFTLLLISCNLHPQYGPREGAALAA